MRRGCSKHDDSCQPMAPYGGAKLFFNCLPCCVLTPFGQSDKKAGIITVLWTANSAFNQAMPIKPAFLRIFRTNPDFRQQNRQARFTDTTTFIRLKCVI
jgi:hypothetical protein